MKIGIPQIIMLFLLAMSLGIDLAKHGQPREGKHNAVGGLVGVAIQLTLLWFGGFFG